MKECLKIKQRCEMTERRVHLQMDALREELDCSLLQQQISELEDKMNVAVSENDRLQHAVKELEKWKEKLEKESESLSRTNFAFLAYH